MVKNAFETLLIILLPLFVIFTVYRFLLGYDPINFQAVYKLIGESFVDTKDYFSELTKEIGSIFDISNSLVGLGDKFSTGIPVVDNSIKGIVHSVLSLFLVVQNAGYLLWLAFRLLIVFVGDLVDVFRVLTYFLIDSSPYVSQPYYP